MQLPKLSLTEWEDTRLYLQLVAQMVGKTRLLLHPPINHWWHATLYMCGRGLTTGGIPGDGRELEITIDLISHRIVLCLSGETREVPLGGSISEVYSAYLRTLEELGLQVQLDGKPYKCKSVIPFAEDHQHSQYDPAAARRAFDILSVAEGVLKEFRQEFMGKCSPVQVFWHSFDIACTRFSGRRGQAMPGADAVTQEAYSHEVISAGFWFGDDQTPEAAFYCYTAPAPLGLSDTPLQPESAEWKVLNGAPMALLTYEALRTAVDPRKAALDFLRSSYEAGADRAAWPRAELERQSM